MTWLLARRRASEAAAQAVAAAAVVLEAKSNSLVPDLTGALQASSKVDVDRSRAEATVSYSDEAAIPQHENLNYTHDDGQAKFLESALNANRAQLLAIMAGEVRRGFQ